MAEIYDNASGDEITVGLQGCNVCNDALRVTELIVRQLDSDGDLRHPEGVILDDDDGEWLVTVPTGIAGDAVYEKLEFPCWSVVTVPSTISQTEWRANRQALRRRKITKRWRARNNQKQEGIMATPYRRTHG